MTSKPTIVVTGCSSGIGAYCIGRLREDGWRVIASARKATDLERLRDDGYEAHHLDYREADSVAAFAEMAIEAAAGRPAALFNNGAHVQPGAVEDLPVAALREQFEANFFGWHELTRRFVPVMRAQGRGRLVHNSSVLGLVPMPLRGAYTASKYALEGLMLTLRQELEGTGIGVSLIEPGPVPSRIAENALPFIDRYIDVEGSVHADLYRKRIAELRAGGTSDDGGRGLEAVYRALRHALDSRSPKPHYHITPQTHGAALMKRALPSGLLYRLLARAA